VEFLGELSGEERDQIVASSYATVMPSAWPEPFGLVAIESLACGTPVITRRVGALPEIVREGIDGFFGDDVRHLASVVDRVDELDREVVRASALERFNADRMTDAYENLMVGLASDRQRRDRPRLRVAASRTPDRRAAGALAGNGDDGPGSGWEMATGGSAARLP
jgi:glycosyltransferase involved in cell wall biosynthesis